MSESIRIHTLWGHRVDTYPGEFAPELMVAWDEWTYEDNVHGFNEACKKEIAAWGEDLVAHRHIILTVKRELIERQFMITEVTAEIAEGEDG